METTNLNSNVEKQRDGFSHGQQDAINNREYYNLYATYNSEMASGYYHGWQSIKKIDQK
jgi:hypothetical protein